MEVQTIKNENDNKNIDFILEKFLLLENVNYLIKFGKFKSEQEELIIFVKEENIISSEYYQESFSLENLHKISKFFILFETIDEIIEYLQIKIDDNIISLQKDLDNLNFSIKFTIGGFKKIKVNLKLTKNNLSIGKIVECLIEQINKMKKEIKENKEEIKEIKEKLDLLFKERTLSETIDSKIIKKSEELNLISDRIKNTELLKNKKIKYKLLYKGTRDGMNASSFHQKCNYIPNTVSIVQTTKGFKFGGYAEKAWENNTSGNWIIDDKAFVFSIDYMKIYNHNVGKYAILHNDNYGPTFEGCFYLRKDFTKNDTYDKNSSNNCFSGFNRDYELNDGEKYFSLSEIEVFQIILE